MADDYDQYVRAEWKLFGSNAARDVMARELLRGVAHPRVLDVGCGAAQELRAFVTDVQVFGVGVDLSAQVGIAARELFAAEPPGSRIAFVRAAAERLPFSPASHNAPYYLRKLRHALTAMHLKPAIHACRALFAGCLDQLTGVQPRIGLVGSETFQTTWLLRRELGRCGLEVRRELGDSLPVAPHVLIGRSAPPS